MLIFVPWNTWLFLSGGFPIGFYLLHFLEIKNGEAGGTKIA